MIHFLILHLVVLSKQFRLTELLCWGNINKINGFIKILFYNSLNFVKRDTEELTASVNHIELPIFKCTMQRSFKCRSIIRKNKCMYIKIKWNRGITQFINAIHRFKPASHTNFVDTFTKGTNV